VPGGCADTQEGRPDIHPGNLLNDKCDGVDNDCEGNIDNSPPCFLEAAWILDEKNGETAQDGGPSGFHGAVAGVADWVDGRVDGGLHFDGATHVQVSGQLLSELEK